MPTNILYLPVAVLAIETVTNADWLDGLEYHDGPAPAGSPIDLAGIAFEMEMRSSPPVATVVLRASVQNGLIRVYANTWQFLIPAKTMALIPPGDYVFDMLGKADGYTRNLVQATCQIDLGITRSGAIPSSPSLVGNIARVDGVSPQGA